MCFSRFFNTKTSNKKEKVFVVGQLVFWYTKYCKDYENVDLSDKEPYEWRMSRKKRHEHYPTAADKIDMNKIQFNFWITNYISLTPVDCSYPNLAASIIPKIYKCDAVILEFHSQTLTLNEFSFFASKVKNCTLEWTTINENDGKTEVMFEKIIEKLPKIQKLKWFNYECFTRNTVKEILKIPHFTNITSFTLICPSELFDVKTFFGYIKKRKNIKFYYECQYTDRRLEREIDEIVNEIISTEVFTYKPPYITYSEKIKHGKKEEEISPSKAAALEATLRNHRGQPIFPGEIQQHFSLPESIIKYIAMHPSNAEVYKKLIRTCKYFYNQNPILVVQVLEYVILDENPDDKGEWKISFASDVTRTTVADKNKVRCKLWITRSFHVLPGDDHRKNIAASIVSKIYRCDASNVSLQCQTITFDDFLLLASNVEDLIIDYSTINENDGKTEIMFEKVIENLPKLHKIDWMFLTEKCFSPNTVAELLKIQHFGNITSLQLGVIPEIFDAKALFEAVKMKHKNMKLDIVYFEYGHGYSDQFKQHFYEIIDEILSTEVFTYKPPLISYGENDWNKFDKMKEMHNRYKNTQF